MFSSLTQEDYFYLHSSTLQELKVFLSKHVPIEKKKLNKVMKPTLFICIFDNL